MRLVLDTSAYSYFRGNNADIVDRITSAEVVYVPTIVLGELEAAFRIGTRTADNRSKLEDFLGEDFVSVLTVTSDVARRYGELFATLRKAGTPIPVNDIWIAAVAMDAGAHLLSFDSDFKRIVGLDCTIYSP